MALEFGGATKNKGKKKMRKRNLLAPFITITMSLFLVILLAVPASAVTRARASELDGGWQIWIEASDFDTIDALKLGSTEALAAAAPPPLGQDTVIALVTGGFAEYNFVSPHAGDAHMYCRNMDFRPGGGQSWHVVLNSEIADEGLPMDTTDHWAWHSGRDDVTLAPKALVAGNNTARIIPREAEPGREILMDIIVISTVAFEPTDDAFNGAGLLTAVEPEAKMATMWGAIKSSF